MDKILVAVDDTKGSLAVIKVLHNLLGDCLNNGCAPRSLILLYVQKLEGPSVMTDLLLSVSEMETLKESVQETDYQKHLDQKAEKVLTYFKDLLEEHGFSGIVPMVREGHPAEEILQAAKENDVDMVIIGSRGKRLHNLWMGSISREVANNAPMAVLIARNQSV